MKNFWDERFGQEDYIYGLQPNEYLKAKIESLTPSSVFLPCEGEGRNAVYAAALGWQVYAMDSSSKGRSKAINLAKKNNLEIDYALGDCLLDDFPSVDLIALCFGHFPTDSRRKFHDKLINRLLPGGYLVFECFSKEQIGRSSGGPKNLDLLYDLDSIKEDFKELEILELTQEEVLLDEGPFHQGEANVIRFFGKKA